MIARRRASPTLGLVSCRWGNPWPVSQYLAQVQTSLGVVVDIEQDGEAIVPMYCKALMA